MIFVTTAHALEIFSHISSLSGYWNDESSSSFLNAKKADEILYTVDTTVFFWTSSFQFGSSNWCGRPLPPVGLQNFRCIVCVFRLQKITSDIYCTNTSWGQWFFAPIFFTYLMNYWIRSFLFSFAFLWWKDGYQRES